MKSWKCEKWRLCKPVVLVRLFHLWLREFSLLLSLSLLLELVRHLVERPLLCGHAFMFSRGAFLARPFLALLRLVTQVHPLSTHFIPWYSHYNFRTLSGILRLSPRRSVLTLKVSLHPTQCSPWLTATFQDRFIRLLKNSHIPDRNDVNYNKGIRQRHAAVLGICALVESFPYTVEKWLPELLTGVLAEHTYDPVGPFQKCWIFLNSLNWLL